MTEDGMPEVGDFGIGRYTGAAAIVTEILDVNCIVRYLNGPLQGEVHTNTTDITRDAFRWVDRSQVTSLMLSTDYQE